MKLNHILVFLLIATTSCGQDFSTEIDKIYDFIPSKLSTKEQGKKMPLLDKFWNKIKKDTSQYLPLLRTELKSNSHNPYFYYDCSGLLLNLSNSRADKELAVNAISKSDIGDIAREDYVRTLNRLANDGLDVTKPAIKILFEEKYSFYVPQHAMVFEKPYCLTFMLLPQKNLNYVDSLIAVFSKISQESQLSTLITLYYSYSCKGDNFIKSIIEDKNYKTEIRDFASKIMTKHELEKEELNYINSLGKFEKDNLRTNALKRFSDEAISELNMATQIMRKEKNCN
jgi:hypothetical protein